MLPVHQSLETAQPHVSPDNVEENCSDWTFSDILDGRCLFAFSRKERFQSEQLPVMVLCIIVVLRVLTPLLQVFRNVKDFGVSVKCNEEHS